jgi:hypothetical protein
MAWSVSAVGRSEVVAASIASQIAGAKCDEPEESIKNLIGQAIALALANYASGRAVKVTAHGSQYGAGGKPETNALSVQIEPIHGFMG